MRNISICYFFFKGRVDAGGGGIIEHCPTEEMWGGFFAKLLQGSKFRRFRLVILVNSRAGKPLPPRSMLDPKVSSLDDVMGCISTLTGGARVRITNQKINVQVKG